MFQDLPHSIISKINLWNSTPFADDIKKIAKDLKKKENINIYTSLINYIKYLSSFNKKLCSEYNIVYKPFKFYFTTSTFFYTPNLAICECESCKKHIDLSRLKIDVTSENIPESVSKIKIYNKSKFTKKETIPRNNIRKVKNRHKTLNMF